MATINHNPTGELALLLEKLLEERRIKKIYCAEGRALMPPDAYFSVNDRLAVPLSGCHRMKILSGGKVTEIRPRRGNMTFIPEGTWNKPDWELPATVATFGFAPEGVDISYVKCHGKNSKENSRVRICIGKIQSDGLWILSLMHGFFRAGPIDSRGIAAAEILLHYCLDNLKNQNDMPGKAKTTWIRISRYLEECFSSNISRDDLASVFHISPNYLSNLFQYQAGMTFIEYLNSIRIKYACTLLESTDNTLDEISISSGFNETSYFCRVFKKKTGISPSAYRWKIRFEKSKSEQNQ